jgi:hypothetical protein
VTSDSKPLSSKPNTGKGVEIVKQNNATRHCGSLHASFWEMFDKSLLRAIWPRGLRHAVAALYPQEARAIGSGLRGDEIR